MHGTFTLTGRHTTLTGVPRTGYVVVTPNTEIRDMEDKIVMAGPVTANLDTQGAWSVELPCDSPTLNPASGIGYTIAYVLDIKVKRQSFLATADLTGGELDVVNLVTVSLPKPLTTVIGPRGPEGPASPDSLTLEEVSALINRQAYAGGHYDATQWADYVPNQGATKLPVLGYGEDVQGLASGGWDMTGKGGLYRIYLTAGFYWNDDPEATVNTSLSYVLRQAEPEGYNLLANVFPSPGPGAGAYYNWKAEHFVQIADDAGPIVWDISPGVFGGAFTGLVSVDFRMDFERIAGWPI